MDREPWLSTSGMYQKQHICSWHDCFIKAADMVKNYAPGNSKTIFDYAFKVLADVKWSVPVITQWSIVYDLKKLHIRYRTIDNKQIRYVDLNSFDFSCKSPVKLLDVNADLSGDITKKFIDYSYERNRDNIKKVFNFPEAVLNAMAQYPESTVCADE